MNELTVVQLPAGKLAPNPWNPNRMSPEMYHKLREYLRREGLVEPIVVRPKGEMYEILGGYHRWKICKHDLGHETVPCIIVDLDDGRARILSINLNELKGQSGPDILARLIHELSRELTLADLSTQLPYSEAELADVLEILKVPDGLKEYLDSEVERAERERPQVLSFVVDEPETVEAAIRAAQAKGGPATTRGRALLEICRAFLPEEKTR
jgi:ParB family chromosome partitioning protein